MFAPCVASFVSARVPPISASVLVAAAYTLPFASTPSPLEVSPVNHWVLTVSCVVEALVEEAKFANVDDAASESLPDAEQRYRAEPP